MCLSVCGREVGSVDGMVFAFADSTGEYRY